MYVSGIFDQGWRPENKEPFKTKGWRGMTTTFAFNPEDVKNESARRIFDKTLIITMNRQAA